MSTNIKVVARFRPQNTAEAGSRLVVEFDDDCSCQVFGDGANGATQFTFDRVFSPTARQAEVFEYSIQPTVDDVMSGYNGTVFAYGQTGSGKSYTMMGPDLDDPEAKGAIPRIVERIFDVIEHSGQDMEYMVRVSYMEIYMERIRDLLQPENDNLAIHEDKTRGIYVKDLAERYVGSVDEVMAVMRRGSAVRATAATNMNHQSSRSHAIFMIVVSQKNVVSGAQKSGQLFVVDLAGSEKVGKTGAQGQTLEEAKKINKSLSALGMVINALTDGKSSHIPYRDSKLTRILQESLGGNSRTSLIVNCSPAAVHQNETLSTLRFGVRAKTIKNKAKINTELGPQELRALLRKSQAHAQRLEQELLQWRSQTPITDSRPSTALSMESSSPSSSRPASALAAVMLDQVTSPNLDSDEWMRRENELQDQIADRDALLQRHEKVFSLVRQFPDEGPEAVAQRLADMQQQLTRTEFANQDLQIRVDALQQQYDLAATELETARQQVLELSVSAVSLESKNENDENEESATRATRQQKLAQLMNLSSPDTNLAQATAIIDSLPQSPDISRLRDLIQVLGRSGRSDSMVQSVRQASLEFYHQANQSNADDVHQAALEKLKMNEEMLDKLTTRVQALTDENESLRQGAPGLDETMKQSLMRDLQNRCERIVELEILLDKAHEQYNLALRGAASRGHDKKMALLQRNLEHLTGVQRALMRQNETLKQQVAMSHKFLDSRNDRIQYLEQLLHTAQATLVRETGNFEARLALLKDRMVQMRSAPAHGVNVGLKIVKPLRGGGSNVTLRQEDVDRPSLLSRINSYVSS